MSSPAHVHHEAAEFGYLGKVPKNWNVVRLKNALATPITDGPHETPHFTDDGIRFLSVDGIQDGELQFEGCRYISEESHAEYRTKALPQRDDLLMGKSASTGKIARVKVDFEFSIWSPLALIRVKTDSFDPAFVEYCLKSPFAQSQIDNFCTSNTQKNISMGDIPKLVMPFPPLDEQKAISSFLDVETSKIDGLVSEQRRLIELLKEKRQAVISHAVTKGLNPNAPMKPSGIQWLGDVPEHWDVSKIKYECQYESGHTPSKSNPSFWIEEDCHIPWVSLNDTKTIDAADFIDDTNTKISEVGMANSSAHLIDAGAVVFTRDGARVGLSSITTKPMCVSQHIIAWVCGPRVSNHYLLHVIYAMNAEIYRITAGSTIPTIGMPDVKRMTMPLPPIDEQSAIVDFLVSERERFATLIAQAERAIELLQERRTALISAAVTGKIDVRQLPKQVSISNNG